MINTFYYVVYPSSLGPPTATQVIAGQDVNGDAATSSGSEVLTEGIGLEEFSFTSPATGLANSTSYCAAIVCNSSGTNSNVAVTPAFTTKAIDVHWPSGVITVYKTDPFMAFAGGNVYNMDTNAFRLALKDAEDDPIGMPFPDTHRHNTTVLLGGIEYARIIEILAPYTVTFDDSGGPWVCNLIGSNNNILDRANLTTVQIRSNNSAGLTQMQEIQYSSFENGVTVDVLNGVAGTAYPAGTRRQPVNNLADAMVIADLYGFGTIYVIGDMTIDSGGNYTGMSFIGESKNKSTLTVSSAANVYKCEFYEAHVTGVLDGDSVLRDCLVDNLNYVSGFVERCVLAPGVITLGGSTTAHFLDCYSGVPGTGTPTIDMGGDGPPLAIRNYNGGIALTNKSGSDSVSIDLNSGQVLLTSSVTAGEIVIRGMGNLTNNSVGATVNSENLLDLPQNIASIVSAILTAAQATPIHANMKQGNDEQMIGDGSAGNKWRSHLVP